MRMPDSATVVSSTRADHQLRRKCSCGSSTSGECDFCKKEKEGLLQRSASSAPLAAFVPPIVHDVLGSPGQPLEGVEQGD
jgi:hypothetical protein